jgi:arabinofuranosyltransferase
MPARSRRHDLVAAALLLVALVHAWQFRHHLTDDAFISFRYLANLFDGHGLVYNPGERVWGFTNFLWMAVLAPWVAAGLDPLACARALGLLATLCLFALVLWDPPAGRGGPRSWNPAGAALLAASGPFLLQAWSGLETAFFSLLLLLTLRLHSLARERPGWPGLAAGGAAALATLTRPEGIFLFGLLLLDAICERRVAAAPLAKRLAALLLGFAPLVLVYQACMGSYYGGLYPNSIDAKVALSREQILRGLHYAAVFFRHYPVYCVVPLAAAWRWRSASPDERLLLRAALLFAAFPVAVGGDWMLGYRLFHPLMVLVVSLVSLALAGIPERVPSYRRRSAAVATLVALFCLLSLAGSLRDPHVAVATRPTLMVAAIRIGEWMRANLPSDAVLATNTAGSIPFHSRLSIIDMMGLNDEVIARRRDLPDGWKGIEKGDGAYVLSRRPDYIQLGSYLGSPVPLFLSDIELFASEEFHRSYQLVSFEVDPETTLRLWRRREHERGPLDPEERERIQRVAQRQLELSAFRY